MKYFLKVPDPHYDNALVQWGDAPSITYCFSLVQPESLLTIYYLLMTVNS